MSKYNIAQMVIWFAAGVSTPLIEIPWLISPFVVSCCFLSAAIGLCHGYASCREVYRQVYGGDQ